MTGFDFWLAVIGEVREWVLFGFSLLGAGIALLGAGVALVTYRDRVKTEVKAQARLVYSSSSTAEFLNHGVWLHERLSRPNQWSVLPQTYLSVVRPSKLQVPGFGIWVEIEIHNLSQEVIGPVYVDALDQHGKSLVDNRRIKIEAIRPNAMQTAIHVWQVKEQGIPVVRSKIEFRDAAGMWWRRYEADPIERLPHAPAEPHPAEGERWIQIAPKAPFKPPQKDDILFLPSSPAPDDSDSRPT